MPPFRYLGNILQLRECAFRPRRGKSKIALARARADEGGLAYADGGLVLHASALIGQYRPGPLCPFARLLTSEMFVWHAA